MKLEQDKLIVNFEQIHKKIDDSNYNICRQIERDSNFEDLDDKKLAYDLKNNLEKKEKLKNEISQN